MQYTLEAALDHLDDTLSHYGVKGMRWGVRRKLKKIDGAQARKAFLQEKDAKWIAKVEANPKLKKIGRLAQRDAKRGVRRLQAEYKANGLNIKKDKLARQRYDRDVKVVVSGAFENAAYKTHKLSPSRVLEVEVIRNNTDWSLEAVIVPRSNATLMKQNAQIVRAEQRRKKKAERAAKKAAANHAEMEEQEVTLEDISGMVFKFEVDEDGLATDVWVLGDDEMSQEDLDAAVDFLEHYGIKGMRWGVRRSDAQLSRARKGGDPEEITLTYKPGGKVKTAGGANHPPSDDYKKAAVAGQKARSSGSASLSNAELQSFVQRANLEAQYAQVVSRQTAAQKNAAVKFMQDVALQIGKKQATEVGNKYVGKAIKGIEKAAKNKK